MTAATVAFANISNFADTANNDTLTATVGVGDQILLSGMTADQGITFTSTPTVSGVTGMTFSAVSGLPTSTANSCGGYGWLSTPATSAGTATVTATKTGGVAVKGIAGWVIAAGTSAGVLAHALTDLTDVVNFTRAASSIMCATFGDWAATVVPTAPAPSTVPAGGTKRLAQQEGSQATFFVVDWLADQGAAGSANYGISGFTTTANLTKLVFEVLGTGSPAATAPPLLRRFPRALLIR